MNPERQHVVWAAVGVVLVGLLWWDLGFTLFFNLTVAGLAQGGVLGLSGLGLVLTYRATGVLNFAHGAIGMFVAYALWQLGAQWGWPLVVAAPIALVLVGPGLGVALDRLVFRPLEVRSATTAEKFVATIGVFVLLVGLATVLWTAQTRTDPVALFPNRSLTLFGSDVRIGLDQALTLGLTIGLAIALFVVLRTTTLGRNMRAVVDNRSVAALAGVNAHRVGAVAWALGAGLAGLTGVLLAPVTFGLDPFRLTLLVIETFSVAVIARLASFPLAIGSGLAIGLLTSYQRSISFGRLASLVGFSEEAAQTASNVGDPILVNLPVFALMIALLVYRSFPEIGAAERASSPEVGPKLRRSTARSLVLAVVASLIGLPHVIATDSAFRSAHTMVALAIIFVSIVLVTGYSGHITLMQAGFAGMGAFFTGRLATGNFLFLPPIPTVPAMVLAGLVCVPLGLAAAYPALRRRGLFLGLTTLGFGLVLERYVFNSFYLNPGPSTTAIQTPTLFGLDLDGSSAFYYYELVVLACIVGLAVRLRSRRAGRALAAIRDSQEGAEAVGIRVRSLKLFVFSAGAFVAGIGGSLLGQASGGFDGSDFITFNSLFWFAIVVVCGVGSVSGALLAAFLFTMSDVIVGDAGVSVLLVGLGAASVGRFGGGVINALLRLFATPRPGPTRSTGPYYLRPSVGSLRPTPAAQDAVDSFRQLVKRPSDRSKATP